MSLSAFSFDAAAVGNNGTARIRANWALDDNVTSGTAGFVINLPTGLSAVANLTFALTDSEGGTIGTCLVSSTRQTVDCELTPGYVSNGQINRHGDVWFSVQVTVDSSETGQDHTFVIDGVESGPIRVNGPEAGIVNQNVKLGYISNDGLQVGWNVYVKTNGDAGLHVTVVDHGADANLAYADTSLREFCAGDADYHAATSTPYQVSADLTTVDFVTVAGCQYFVRYMTTIINDAPSYSNYAEITIDGVTVPVQKTIQTGGGSGVGEGVGAFSVSKVLAGDGADLVPADMEFTGAYSYPAGDDFEAGSGTWTARAAETWISPSLPAGAVVTVSETSPSAVSGGAWAAAAPDQIVVIVEGQTAALTITNTINADSPSEPPTQSTEPPTQSTEPPGDVQTPPPAISETVTGGPGPVVATGGTLPLTGTVVSPWWVAGGAVAVLLGGALTVGGRRPGRR